MPDQLVFDWPSSEALSSADFFVSEANHTAVNMLRAPDTWPEHKLVLVGPEGSGKSHLARIFEQETGAFRCQAGDIPVNFQGQTPVVVEDADQLPADQNEALFHLHNALRARALPLLLTARTSPARWVIALPDLASRMQATTPITIQEPDDALLTVLLTKLFSDRQVMPSPAVINYLAARIDRTYADAKRTVDLIDREALALGKPPSIKIAAALLDNDR